MKELSLDELKVIELDILKMFHRFCAKNNIRYYLAFGTLLGAIRYKGFIPWDDDVDVLVPREDYDRLLTLFQDNERYRLLAFERNCNYAFPFAKLCDMTTRLEEMCYPNNGVELGVNIDIFPLDNFNDDLEDAKKEIRRIRKNNACLGYLKVDKPQTDNPLKFAVWSLIIAYCKMRGSKHYVQKIIKECKKPEQKGSRYVGSKVWPIWGDRVITPAEAFDETIEIEFEGERFFAPAGYDIYLTCLYGDYLPEPPVEKRKTHHSFKAYKL
jgi:lipopolysaccharide cholinephosphotransferase